MAESDISGIAIACSIFMSVLIAAFVVLYQIRKRTDPRRQGLDDYGGLTMEALESMYDAGMISQEEFSELRRALLGIPGEKKAVTSDSDSDILDNSDENGKKGNVQDDEGTINEQE